MQLLSEIIVDNFAGGGGEVITDYKPWKGLTLLITACIVDAMFLSSGIVSLICLALILLWASKGGLK